MDERIMYDRNQLVYDLARFDRRSRVQQTLEEAGAPRVEPKHKTMPAISLGAWPVAVFFMFTTVVLLIVFSFATLSEISRENQALTKSIANAKKQTRVLTAQLETRIMLDEVGEIATSKLGMVKPDHKQYVYIDLSGPEKIEVFKRQNSKDAILQKLNDTWKDMLEYFG